VQGRSRRCRTSFIPTLAQRRNSNSGNRSRIPRMPRCTVRIWRRSQTERLGKSQGAVLPSLKILPRKGRSPNRPNRRRKRGSRHYLARARLRRVQGKRQNLSDLKSMVGVVTAISSDVAKTAETAEGVRAACCAALEDRLLPCPNVVWHSGPLP
jgi:hypothetical protein